MDREVPTDKKRIPSGKRRRIIGSWNYGKRQIQKKEHVIYQE